MEGLLQHIAQSKDDVVFVGSWVARLNGRLNRQPNDIDIVVTTLDGLERFGEILTFETKSPFSNSGKRAVIQNKEGKIDIFIESTLPRYDVIKYLKVQTLESQIDYFNQIISRTDAKPIKDKLMKNISLLK